LVQACPWAFRIGLLWDKWSLNVDPEFAYSVLDDCQLK